jgi:cytochrome c peroxidase
MLQIIQVNSGRSLLLSLTLFFAGAILSACGGGSNSNPTGTSQQSADPPANQVPEPEPEPEVALTEIDIQLQAIIQEQGLTGNPAVGRDLPSIEDPVAQLGKKLFFSKSLSGDMDTACVSCHHPLLGGSDQLSLAVGVGASNPNLLGPGRADADGLPGVSRNSPTVFNTGLVDRGLFWDSRLESLTGTEFANGAGGGIRTPESAFNTTDPNAGANLLAAQARIPVTSGNEMLGSTFEAGGNAESIRTHLAARLGDYGLGAGELAANSWITEFQLAFSSTQDATQLITFDNIAFAIGEFQRSMVFVDNSWFAYVNGDLDSLTDQQKNGAVLFYTSVDEGGAGCFNCHSGDRLSDDLFHTIAFPQIGQGKGHGPTSDGDFGRGAVSGVSSENFSFRTPSLLNVEVTAPFGHAGSYASLDDTIGHYDNPTSSIADFLNNQEWCDLPQFAELALNCLDLYPNVRSNSDAALDKLNQERIAGESLFQNANLGPREENALEVFLRALTDPCVLDPACLAPWIADETSNGPDNNQLNAEFNN